MEIKANINSVMVGRVLAGIIIVLGFIVAVWNGADAQRGGFRIFLQQMINPVFFRMFDHHTGRGHQYSAVSRK